MLNECNGCEYQCKLSHVDICTLGSPCPHQRSTPITNEDWFCGLPTEEKAEFLVMIQMSVMHPVKRGAVDMEKFIEEVAEWLKQPHTDS